MAAEAPQAAAIEVEGSEQPPVVADERQDQGVESSAAAPSNDFYCRY